MPEALIVYNPTSGRQPPQAAVLLAEKIMSRRGWKVEVAASQSGESMVNLARQAAACKTDVLFVAGGDGSLHNAVQGLAGSQTALAHLPVGTANVWSQELGLVRENSVSLADLEGVVERLLAGKVYAMDLGRCNQEYFLTWTGIGLDGLAIRRIEPRSRLAKYFSVQHFIAMTLWEIPGWRGMDLTVEIEGQTHYDHCLLALASGVRLYMGGKCELAQDVYLDDGVQDLWLLKGSYPHQSFVYALKMANNRHYGMSGLSRISYREIKLTADTTPMQMDGDPVTQENPLNFCVAASALQILAPQQLPRKMFLQPGRAVN